MFNIKNKVCEHNYNHVKNIVKYGKYYTLFLGVELFNSMMDNYSYSMPRKRRKFKLQKERNHSNKKYIFNISKEELSNIIWKNTINEIAKKYNVNRNAIIYKCKEFNINRPEHEYWQKIKKN